ncbi:MAG TPA: ImmA/IrrE family metallo-endopeptidase [Thermoanaerobaculia bacterium]|nr:ImmA/IrrE family metallo-endopeptidase [Thermoanaerobaculia bacterium]
MSKLTLDFEWIDPAEAKGPELRATWASLKISLEGNEITRLFDGASRSVRSRLFLPLYPLAEWIATHWWFLLVEVETPGRSTSDHYDKRHNIRYGSEGFALPSLTIQPMGERIRLAWQPARLDAQNLEFMASGSAYIPEFELRQTLSDFIAAVLGRLHDHGIENTLLEEEWNGIQAIDSQEQEFCSVVASLGLDPYTLSEQEQEKIMRVSERLPLSLWPDFFELADFSVLSEQADQVLDAVSSSRRNKTDLASLKSLRQEIRADKVTQRPPWEQGYEFARELRQRLNLNGERLSTLSSLEKALGVPSRKLDSAIIRIASLPGAFNALVATNARESPVFTVPQRRGDATRFALCRALFEYLTTPAGEPLLVTGARSERQKRNRAFAAEFLVPRDLLRGALPSQTVGDEEIDDLAAAFGVSPSVVRHQIENHRLALPLSD